VRRREHFTEMKRKYIGRSYERTLRNYATLEAVATLEKQRYERNGSACFDMLPLRAKPTPK
jgi:hypothetical protein